MKIGIISDTHNLLRTEVLAHLQGCDAILHAGDINSQAILTALQTIAPICVVRGNNDKEWAEDIPVTLDFELAGLHIFMTHKKKDLPKDLSGYDLVIVGHSHQYVSTWLNTTEQRRTLLLNPGSCGPRHFNQPITMAMLSIGSDGWNVDRIEIPHTPKEAPLKVSGGDIRQQIEIVMRETKKGETVELISKKHGMEPALVEQIMRLYVTHPGVTADGIMTKMGL